MKNIVVFTGAGVSAESGLGTFRDSDGLWEKYRIEDVCTHEAWLRNPQLCVDFYNARRRDTLAAKPNAAHETNRMYLIVFIVSILDIATSHIQQDDSHLGPSLHLATVHQLKPEFHFAMP